MQRLNPTLWHGLMKQMDTFLFDCDGVLWITNTALAGAAAAVDYLQNHDKRVILVTNNSSQTPRSYFEKCHDLGINISSEGNVVTTSAVTSDYLKNVLKCRGKVYVIGSRGLGEELERCGYSHFGVGPDVVESDSLSEIGEAAEIDPEVKAVTVGVDPHMSYAKVLKATTYLAKPDCVFVATNEDARFPTGQRSIVFPGAGVMVAAVKTSSRREPVVMGKPNKPMFDYIKSRFNIDVSKTIMIGDSLQTDIAFAKANGMKSLLVLTGNTSFEDMRNSDVVPDYFTDSVADFCRFA